jgi:hypothetical protein
VQFSPYALERMNLRRITHEEVEAVLAAPEFAGSAKDGRWAAWARIDGRSIIVVTVFPQRRRPEP